MDTTEIAPAVAYSRTCPHSVDWDATPAPVELPAEERGRLIYRVAAEVAQRLDGMPGWRVQRSGVAVQVWIGPDRYRCRPPDYTIWAEDYVDQHLHKSIETSVRRKLSEPDSTSESGA